MFNFYKVGSWCRRGGGGGRGTGAPEPPQPLCSRLVLALGHQSPQRPKLGPASLGSLLLHQGLPMIPLHSGLHSRGRDVPGWRDPRDQPDEGAEAAADAAVAGVSAPALWPACSPPRRPPFAAQEKRHPAGSGLCGRRVHPTASGPQLWVEAALRVLSNCVVWCCACMRGAPSKPVVLPGLVSLSSCLFSLGTAGMQDALPSACLSPNCLHAE